MMRDWNMGWDGMWLFGPIIWIAVIALVVVLAVAAVRGLGDQGAAKRESPRSPRDILDERFAKGEIDQAEYESRRKALEG